MSKDPAIQDSVANLATDELFKEVDVQQLAQEALPPKAQFLAAPIASGVQDFIRKQAHALVASPQFSKLWEEANRRGHDAIIKALTANGDVVKRSGGKVYIDLSSLAEAVQARLAQSNFKILSGISLGGVTGQFVLFQSSALAQLSSAIAFMNQAALVLPILALVLLGLALWAAPDKRKAILWIGIGVMIVTVVPLAALSLVRNQYLTTLPSGGVLTVPAAQSAFDIVTAALKTAERTGFVLGLVIAIGAGLMGPSRFATKLRHGLAHGLAGVGAEWDFGAFGTWVAAHKAVLRGVGTGVGFLVLVFWGQPTPGVVLGIALLILIWLGLVEFFGRGPTAGVSDRPSPGGD